MLFGFFGDIEFIKVNVIIGDSVLFEVTEVALVFALLAVLFEVVAGEHLTHI